MDKCDITTPLFSLCGKSLIGRVVNVLDGDTLSIILPLYHEFFRFNVRLNGIDTCETKSNNPELKNMGLQAKKLVIDTITCKQTNESFDKQSVINLLSTEVYTVRVECLEFDKYGRLLADVYVKDKNLSDLLLENKLAYQYTGKTKLTDEELLEFFSN
jgi:endonuclease YncB( thermonuclease family)